MRLQLLLSLLLSQDVLSFAPVYQPKPVVKPLGLSSQGISPTSDGDPHLPPGRRTPRFLSFLFDDTIQLINPKTMGSYQLKRKKQYGKVFKTNIFCMPTVFVTGEDALADLGKEEARGTMEAFFPPHHQRLFGEQALLVQSGETHSRLRRLIQPILAPSVTSSLYQPIIDDALKTFLSELKEENDYFKLVPKIRAFFISIAIRILLGKDAAVPEGLAEDLTTWSKGLVSAPLTFIPWSTAAKAVRARKRILATIEPMLEAERQSDQSSNSLLGRFVSSKDDEGNTLSNQDIMDNVLTLIFAGSDTTASAATSMILAMSLDPNLKKEARDDSKVEALVQQVLEKYPPAPFSMRLAKQPLSIKGYDIQADWLVVYGFAGALGDRDDQTVSPDTAAPARSVSFGAGPRMCPGRYLAVMELTMLCRELLDYQWTLKGSQDLTQTYTPGFFPKDGLQIRFQ